ncbi:MAG: DUF3466 family protein [Nitrospirales bacterium]|nr:DUF3466 family protein [Nitrospirales bacterium]
MNIRSVWYCAWTTIAAILLILTPLSAATAETRYLAIDLGTLGGPQSFAGDINEEKQITGNASVEPGRNFPLQAFRWKNGSMTNLGTLPGAANDFSRGFGINDAGTIVGESGNGPSFAFRADNGVLTQLPSLNFDGTGVANDINNAEQIVGASTNTEGTVRAYLIEGNAIHDLGTLEGSEFSSGRAFGINAKGQIVGISGRSTDSSLPSQATLWRPTGRPGKFILSNLGSLGDGNLFSEAAAISDRGIVVGRSTVPESSSRERAVRWRKGRIADLGDLGFNNSRATDVNNVGQIVGFASTFQNFPTLGGAAFLWEHGVLTDLNKLIPTDTGWELLAAQAINDKAHIVGFGRLNGNTRAFLLVPNCSAADFNNDDKLNIRDVTQFLFAVKTRDPLADFNQDGNVNRADARAFFNFFKPCLDDDDEDDDSDDDD